MFRIIYFKLVFVIAFIGVILFFSTCVLSQEKNIEELEESIKTTNENDKSAIFNKLASKYYWNTDKYDLVLLYAKKALRLSKKYNQTEEIIRAYANFSLYYCGIKSWSKASKYSDKALKLAEKLNNIDLILFSLESKINVYSSNYDFISLVEAYKSMLPYLYKKGDKFQIAIVNHSLGTFYTFLGNNQIALKHYKIALDMYNNLNNKAFAVHIMSYIAYIEAKYFKNHEKGLELLFNAKDIVDKNDLGTKKCRIYTGIGRAYLIQKKYDLSLKYLKMSLNFAEDFKADTKNFWLSFNFEIISKVFLEKNDPDKALEYVNKAINIKFLDKSRGDNRLEDLYFIKGKALFNKSLYNESYECFFNSRNFYQKNKTNFKYKFNIGMCYKFIGMIFHKKKDYKNAVTNFLMSLSIFKNYNKTLLVSNNTEIKSIYKILSELYASEGKNKLSNKYLNLYDSLKDYDNN